MVRALNRRLAGMGALAFAVAGVASSALAAPTLTVLHNFAGTSASGASPVAGVVVDAAGNLYGTTTAGGTSNAGTLYRIPGAGGSLTNLVQFQSLIGSSPSGGLVLDPATSRLYGTTTAGGSSSGGTVFRITTSGSGFTTLSNLSASNGTGASGAPILDPLGNVYITTAFGGTLNRGAVLRVPAAGGTPTVLASLSSATGFTPQGGLIASASGDLFLTTSASGANGRGSVVRVPKTGSDASFGGGAVAPYFAMANITGANPQGPLLAESNGYMYGTAAFGGASGQGVVFRLAPGGSAITVLATFTGANGANPYSGLIADAQGRLYGTTSAGGASGRGTVFRVPISGGAIETLYSFTVNDGATPFAGVSGDASGNLYGTTNIGGTNNLGTVFRLSGTGYVVPEPAALGLLLPAATLLGMRRRK